MASDRDGEAPPSRWNVGSVHVGVGGSELHFTPDPNGAWVQWTEVAPLLHAERKAREVAQAALAELTALRAQAEEAGRRGRAQGLQEADDAVRALSVSDKRGSGPEAWRSGVRRGLERAAEAIAALLADPASPSPDAPQHGEDAP